MSLFGQIRPKAIDSAGLEKQILSVYGGGSTQSGISINTTQAMRIMTVQACVRILAWSIAQLPLHLMRINGNMKEKALDHPYYRLLHDQPNDWMTSFDFWSMEMVHTLMRGNGYSIKSGLPGRRVRELIPLPIGAVQEVKQNADYSLSYEVLVPDDTTYFSDTGAIVGTSGSKTVTYPGNQIMHLRGLVVNGFMGMNPIQYAREGLGLAAVAEQFGARYFGSGIHPGMVVQAPGAVKDPKTFLEATTEAYAGISKSHGVMLLESGMTASFPTLSAEDAQFLETRQFQKKEIVDLFFGNPLAMYHSGDKTSTYASAEQFDLAFVKYTLMPWCVNYERSIYRDLLNEDEKKTHYAKFSAEGLLRGAFKDRMDGFATAIDKEIMNPNEVRDLLDMNPYKGGDEYRTRTSTVKQPTEPAKGATT